MPKSLEKAQAELTALDLSFFGTILTYRGGLDIILSHMEEDEAIKDMMTGIHRRATYLMAVTDKQFICGCKPMVGKSKEMVFQLADLESITLKSSFLLGHNIIVKPKQGEEVKFNSDDKKAAKRFGATAGACV